MVLLCKFLADESGTAAVEYALIATCIGLAIIGGANSLGLALKAKFNTIATSLN